jgi:amino acid transporter
MPERGIYGLKQFLGAFSLTSLVVGDMIGAGIFTTSGLLLAQLHDPLLLLVHWAVGGLIALSGALSYSELGANFPRAGGDYAFLSELIHPLAGFLTGWVSFFVGFTAPLAASSLAFSEYLVRTFLVTLLYLLLNILYVYALPAGDMENVISIGGLAANHLFNRVLDQFFSLFIATILLSAISVLTIIGPRVYYAMAESGHFFRLAGRVNRSGVPGTSILMQSTLGILFLAYLERPAESSIALGIIAAGIPVYFLLRSLK